MTLDVFAALPEPPEAVRDGDCAEWSIRVAESLAEHGIDSVPLLVWGWLEIQQRTVGFLHRATFVPAEERIVDFTARQFGASLPNMWVVEPLEYLRRLADATGVAAVSVTNQESGENMSALTINCLDEDRKCVLVYLGEFDTADEAADALERIAAQLGWALLARHVVKSAMMHNPMPAVEWLSKYRVVKSIARSTS